MKINKKMIAPITLAVVGSIGVIATAVIAVKATPKAFEDIKKDSSEKHEGDPFAFTKKEAVVSSYKHYIPSAMVASATITCILAGTIISAKQYAALTSAFTLLDQSYRQYKNTGKGLFGEQMDDQIREAMAKHGYMGTQVVDIDPDSNLMNNDEKILFYDEMSEQYFEATSSSVILAQYHLNRNYIIRGNATLGEYYDFLGLKKKSEDDIVGWDNLSPLQEGFDWIDFYTKKTTMDDGLECIIIYPPIAPYMLSDDYDYFYEKDNTESIDK